MSRYSVLVLVSLGLGVSSCTSAARQRVESAATTETDPAASGHVSDGQSAPPSTREKTATTTPQPQLQDVEKPAGEKGRSADREEHDETRAARPKDPPIDMITSQGTAFIIDYLHSGAFETASATCTEKAEKVEALAKAEEAARTAKSARSNQVAKGEEAAKGDSSAKTDDDEDADEARDAEAAARAEKVEAARAECLKQARDKFSADVLRFRRDGLGHVKLVILRRNGSALKEIYVANVELKSISDRTVKVEIKEAGIGQRPIMKDRRDFELMIPNDYGIELKDPTFGRLPYDAKVGLVAN